MKLAGMACMSLALCVLVAHAALKEGDTAPDFAAPASLAGRAFAYSLDAQLAKGPVVVYFFPSAFTAGCNVQAHSFSENSDKFAAAGVSVIGVSLDSIERLIAFSADPRYCANKLAVASDPDGRIARSFGLQVSEPRPGAKDTRGLEIGHGFAERTTFVVNPDGTIAATIGGVAPEGNVLRALQWAQEHGGSR